MSSHYSLHVFWKTPKLPHLENGYLLYILKVKMDDFSFLQSVCLLEIWLWFVNCHPIWWKIKIYEFFYFFPCLICFNYREQKVFEKLKFSLRNEVLVCQTHSRKYMQIGLSRREKTFKVPKVFLKGVRKEPRIFQNRRMLLPERKRKLWNAVICLGVTHLILKWYRVNYDLIALGQK